MATPVTVTAANGGAWSLQSVNSALQGRLHDGAHFMQTASMATWRDGILSATGTEFQVSALGSPNQTVNVAAGAALATRNGQGPYVMWATPTTNVPLDAAHATLARIDVVYARALDGVFSEGGTTLQFGVLTGTASGSPVEPSLPTAFPNAPVLRLAAITVPSLATRPSNQVQSGDVFDKRRAVAHFDGVRRLLTGDLIGDVGFVAGELRDSTLTATGTGIERWNGSTWDALIGAGAWVAFTPTMTGMSNNAGTFVARYRRIGKTIVMHIDFAPAATASLGSGAVTITGLPVAVSGSSARFTTATGYLFDASGVLRPITGLVSTTTMAIFGLSGNSLLNPGAAGYTWGNSSSLTMDVVYEGA